MTESSNIFKPLTAKTRVKILSTKYLDPLVDSGILNKEHLRYASESDYVKEVYSSDNRNQYILLTIPLLWPQEALLPQGREIFVDHARPTEKRSSFKNPIVIKETHQELDSKLFVGSIPFNLSDSGLINLFSKFGTVRSAIINLDKMTGMSKGFGFVTMLTKKEAIKAIDSLKGVEILGNGEFTSHYFPHKKPEEIDTSDLKKTIITIIETASKEIIKLIYNDPSKIIQIEWRDLERIIATMLNGMGYTVTLTRPAKDGGKDIVVEFTDENEKKLYFIEIKHWVSGKKVGKTHIKHFLSVVVRDKPTKGIIISTSGFTDTAFEGIVEVDQRKLQVGDQNSVIALCRRYVNLNFYPTHSLDFTDPLISCTQELMLQHTKSDEDKNIC